MNKLFLSQARYAFKKISILMRPINMIFVITILLFTGCKKLIDIEPENSITFKNGIQNEKDIESLIGGVDRFIRNQKDIIRGGYNGFNLLESYERDTMNAQLANTYNPILRSSSPNVLDHLLYQWIQQANIPLNYLDQTNLSNERKEYYRGRISFYKAFAYWQLITTFGDVVLLKDDVILRPVAKSPWPEVADYAIAQAENAVRLLPEFSKTRDAQGNSPRNKFVPCKGTANMLLAQLTAWKAGCNYLAQPDQRNYDMQALWKKAADACTEIINSGEYALAANPEAVCEEVLVGGSKEGIYEIATRGFWDEFENPLSVRNDHGIWGPQFVPNMGFNAIKTYFSNYGGWLATEVKKRFPTNDLRRYSWFYKVDSLSNPSLFSITGGMSYPNKFRKFRFTTSGSNVGAFNGLDEDMVIWRLAEVYLLRAECRVRLGNNGGAIADLNVVRSRSSAAPYDNTEGELRYTIFKELSKEMLLERIPAYRQAVIRNGYVKTEWKTFGYDRLTDQDMLEGALFSAFNTYSTQRNPLLRQNVYWLKRFGY